MNYNKYVAELLGAFTLTLVVAFSVVNNFAIITPVLAALVLGVFVYTIGSISGAHLNPAVTIGLWSVRKISVNEAIYYLVAQLIGAGLAGAVVYNVFNFIPASGIVFNTNTLIAEIAGATLFTFGVASVVYGKVKESASGLVIGVSLLLGICVASFMGSMGILNTAVSAGMRVLDVAYLVGPIVGGIVGFNLYKYVAKE